MVKVQLFLLLVPTLTYFNKHFNIKNKLQPLIGKLQPWLQPFIWLAFVAVAQLLIFFISSSVTLNYLIWLEPIDPAFSNSRPYSELILFLINVLLVEINYCRTMKTGPGFVPKNWKPKNPNHEKHLEYCNTSQCLKPPRSYYCKSSKRCVLKFDHYCPWVGTAIGHNNHASFIRFLFFLSVGCAWSISIVKRSIDKHLFTETKLLRNRYKENYRVMNDYAVWFNFAVIAVSFLAMLLVGMLFIGQLYSVLVNRTHIESLICSTAKQIRNRQNNPKNYAEFTYPFDLGCWENFKSVFGYNGFKTKPSNTGLTDWSVIPGTNQFSVIIEHKLQKAYRMNLSKPATAIYNYNKSWYPLTYGPIVGFLLVPKTSNRLQITPGDQITVTDDISQGSQWWFGEKVEGKKKLKGWFPAKAVKLVSVKKET